jgi:hypothetical protein
MEKGFYIFKNSWGTTRFGVTNPYGAGYGLIAQRYVDEYASAYVTGVPTLSTGGGGGGGGGGGAHTFSYSATPALAIPDNDPTGASSTIVPASSDAGTVSAVSVTLDISHTYRGDLTVTLTHLGKTVTLVANDGGSAHDIKQTFTADFTGAGVGGDWVLQVVDGAAVDTGTLNAWSLSVTAN